MKYQYTVIRTDGRPYTITSDNDLFDHGWHELAITNNLNWLFVQQWVDNRHMSTIYNHKTGVKIHFR